MTGAQTDMALTQPQRLAVIAIPDAELYGAGRMAVETVRALRDADWRVIVSSPTDGPLLAEVQELGAQTVVMASAVVRKSALTPTGFLQLIVTMLRSVLPTFRQIRSARPDVVYVSTVTIPLWLIAGRLLRRRVVCHVHEAEGTASATLLQVLNAPLFLAHKILINSEFSRSVLVRVYAALGARTTVVYNSVAGPPTNPSPPRAVLAGPCRLLFVGRLSPRKGPDVAIEATKLLMQRGVDVELNLVGDVFPGYEWFRDQLHGAVRELQLQERVRFHGFLPSAWTQMASSDIVLVPSTVDEPFGNTAVEAALGCRPAVVSSLGGLVEATRGLASVELVEPSEPAAIAEAVAKIIADWDRFASAALHDAARARLRFSRDSYGAEIRKAFAAGRSAPTASRAGQELP